MREALQDAAYAASINKRDGLIIKLEAVFSGIIIRARAPDGWKIRSIEKFVTWRDIEAAPDCLIEAMFVTITNLGFEVLTKEPSVPSVEPPLND